MGKPRSDSILKARAAQSPEFGDKLWEWLNTPKSETCPGGMQHAREQLAADGVQLGGGWLRQLSEFRSWWELQLDVNEAEQEVANIQELLQALDLGLTADQIRAAGQLVFSKRALVNRDPEEFREMEYLRLARETAATKADQEREKIELRKRQAEQKDRALSQKDADLQLAERRVKLLEEQKAQAKQALASLAEKGGLSEEALREIERAAKILQ